MSRQRSILILDEATSNVDGHIDELMQGLIRVHFKDHTVIVVAHRLNTIMNSDKIAFLDNGRLVELDSPAALLPKDSAFAELVTSQ
jgi:ATP-binding cassette subfamily C (CFTR/MRP) protein 1